jgi:hypothetical protein
VIRDGIKAIPDRIKVIHGHFYPIADHLNPNDDRFYPTADHLKVIAGGKSGIDAVEYRRQVAHLARKCGRDPDDGDQIGKHRATLDLADVTLR